MYKNQVIFNLKQLDKLIDTFSKEYFYTKMTEQGPLMQSLMNMKDRDRQRLSMDPNPNSNLEMFLVDLQQKIRVMFKSEYEAYRFFDVNEN